MAVMPVGNLGPFRGRKGGVVGVEAVGVTITGMAADVANATRAMFQSQRPLNQTTRRN